jgi:diguanylate cyclase (GGDEF)-like protein
LLAELDVRTLGVTLSLVTLCMTLLLAVAAWHAGGGQGIRHWALGNFALMLGLMLNVSQEQLHPLLAIVIANGLMALGAGVTWLGIRAFKGLSQPQSGPIVAALVVVLLLWVFSSYLDHPPARLAISSAVLAFLCLLCARELLIPADQPLRTGYWFAGGIALFGAMGLGARALYSLGIDPQATSTDTALHSATLLGAMVMQIGLASGFILMTHYRTTMALHHLSERDALTNTLNRRSLQQRAGDLLQLAAQRASPVTLIMLDADHFKKINDEFGHQTGDAVLCHMVERIRQHLRVNDLLGRFGGEEFVLILPGLDTDSAREVAERIRLGLCTQPWEHERVPVRLSVSLGVACTEHQGYAFDTLLGAADSALYRAKSLGRNRVELAREPTADLQDEMALRLLSQFRHNLDV